MFNVPYRNRLLLLGLSEKEADEFGRWAFGEIYPQLKTSDMPTKWNKLHSDKFKLEDDSLMMETTKKMIEIWKINK